MGKSPIEWTGFTVNPLRARLRSDPSKVGHYCEKISPGCTACYASTFQRRRGLPAFSGTHGRNLELVEPFLDVSKLEEVLRRRTPTVFFWCDMTDMFGSWVPFEHIAACYAIMACTPWHTHQVLTKRPDRHGWPLPNVWFMFSAEDQPRFDERWPLARLVPAVVHGCSYEPALGLVDFSEGLKLREAWASSSMVGWHPRISWIIGGGESGHKARPCDIAWLRSARDQCAAAGVPYFNKQVGAVAFGGAWPPGSRLREMTAAERSSAGVPSPSNPHYVVELRDRKGGDPSEWPADLRVRQMPEMPHA